MCNVGQECPYMVVLHVAVNGFVSWLLDTSLKATTSHIGVFPKSELTQI